MALHGVFVKEGMGQPKIQKELIDVEQNLINKLSKESTEEVTGKTIMDDSINDIIINYSMRMSTVVEDIVKAMTKENLIEEAKTMGWIGVTLRTISVVYEILTRPDNIIYSGFTMIFISIFIYYIFVSS
jgi:hypothetical protein